jgi:hypothetical protein
MIQIDEIVIRAPGMKEAAAASLAAAVADNLSAKIPGGVQGRIGEIKISVGPANGNQERLAAAIAEEILKKLKIATI